MLDPIRPTSARADAKPHARSASLFTKFCGTSALSLSLAAYAAVTPANAESGWAVEIDPATFALDGYSLHGRYSPEKYPAWRVGAGIYSLEFPTALGELKSANRDEGWQVDLEQGLGLFVEHYSNAANTGWFTGLQLANHDFEIANPELAPGETDEYNNVLILPYGGYLHQFNSTFYVQGWAGAGYTETVSGSSTIAAEEYEVPSIFAFAAVHLGYSF